MKPIYPTTPFDNGYSATKPTHKPNCIKVKYTTERFALEDIDRIKRKSIRKKIPTRAYFCKCGFWHLTSKPDKRDEVVFALLDEIKLLKHKLDSLTLEKNREDRIQIKTDIRIKELNERNKKLQKTNSSIRYDLSTVIAKNIQLQRQIDAANNKSKEMGELV